MNWMDKLERKWGRHAVANLSRYFVLAQVIGYVVQLMAPGLMSYMNFDMGIWIILLCYGNSILPPWKSGSVTMSSVRIIFCQNGIANI